MDARRVVVTGVGAVTGFGCGADVLWEGVCAGRTAVGPITRCPTEGLPVRIAAEVRGFEPAEWMPARDVSKVDPYVHYGLAATRLALLDAALDGLPAAPDRVGVYLGSAIGGISSLLHAQERLSTRGARGVSPFLVPQLMVNMLAGYVSTQLGITGPSMAPVSACATGNHCIGEALHAIRSGRIDAALTGASEESIVPLSIAAFSRMRALSRRNDEPERACRPFDVERDGFVLGSGAGVLLLEERERALARGARIHCELAGYGANADAYHLTDPHPEGAGAAACMRLALADAGVAAGEIDYVNAHATGTPKGDVAECAALRSVLGAQADRAAISSTKGATGHLLGAAGAVEAIVALLAVARQQAPGTRNLEQPSPELGLSPRRGPSKPTRIRACVSNGFGFGGTNACLVFRVDPSTERPTHHHGST